MDNKNRTSGEAASGMSGASKRHLTNTPPKVRLDNLQPISRRDPHGELSADKTKDSIFGIVKEGLAKAAFKLYKNDESKERLEKASLEAVMRKTEDPVMTQSVRDIPVVIDEIFAEESTDKQINRNNEQSVEASFVEVTYDEQKVAETKLRIQATTGAIPKSTKINKMKETKEKGEHLAPKSESNCLTNKSCDKFIIFNMPNSVYENMTTVSECETKDEDPELPGWQSVFIDDMLEGETEVDLNKTRRLFDEPRETVPEANLNEFATKRKPETMKCDILDNESHLLDVTEKREPELVNLENKTETNSDIQSSGSSIETIGKECDEEDASMKNLNPSNSNSIDNGGQELKDEAGAQHKESDELSSNVVQVENCIDYKEKMEKTITSIEKLTNELEAYFAQVNTISEQIRHLTRSKISNSMPETDSRHTDYSLPKSDSDIENSKTHN